MKAAVKICLGNAFRVLCSVEFSNQRVLSIFYDLTNGNRNAKLCT